MKLIAEIIGAVAVLTSFVMFQQTNRKRLIFCKFIMDLLWIAHFIILGGYTIVCTTSISVFREIVFINKDKPFFKSKIWLLIFVSLYISALFFTWEGIFSVFPVMSSVAATVSFWIDSVKKTKTISLFVSISQIIYSIARNSYSAITNELVTISSIIISFIRTILSKRALKKGEQI